MQPEMNPYGGPYGGHMDMLAGYLHSFCFFLFRPQKHVQTELKNRAELKKMDSGSMKDQGSLQAADFRLHYQDIMQLVYGKRLICTPDSCHSLLTTFCMNVWGMCVCVYSAMKEESLLDQRRQTTIETLQEVGSL